MNKLKDEHSPYLLQHAENPVDWYPWGEEAFIRAKAEDKPVFLSIGYSTCHWCHVMSQESFENHVIAQAMNKAFINIKVDREERPDLDSLYMRVCQAMTGGGGWPLTVVLTPEKKPFFAGTYFPPMNRHGQLGMLELIGRLQELWRTQRKDVEESAAEIISWLAEPQTPSDGDIHSDSHLHKAFEELCERYDKQNGGFGTSPKFPMAHQLMFLLRYAARTENEQARSIVGHTLNAMRAGGIFDQLGYGFHRYSTDSRWLLPHFEKMLYDQALLSLAYLEGYQVFGDKLYARTAREVLTYVRERLTSAQGGFFSAEDADTGGMEGRFYLWKNHEFENILGVQDAALFRQAYGIKAEGNFQEEATEQQIGANVLFREKTNSELSTLFNIQESLIEEKLESARAKLFEARENRLQPSRDEKILTDWNGLMIAAFARGARVLGSAEYAQNARLAADFILQNLRAPDGALLHRWHAGQAAIPAFLDDYAFLIWGLLELYEASFEQKYLKEALELTRQALQYFWDNEHGALFFTSSLHESLQADIKELHDGAIPSGNAVMALNLVRLGRMMGRADLEEKAWLTGKCFAQSITQMPSAFTHYLVALDFLLGPSTEIVIAGEPGATDTRAMQAEFHSRYLPRATILFLAQGTELSDIHNMAPFTRDMKSLHNKATAYVCRSNTCKEPITGLPEFAQELSRL